LFIEYTVNPLYFCVPVNISISLYNYVSSTSVTQDLCTSLALSVSSSIFMRTNLLQVVLGEQLKKTIFGGFFSIAVGYGLALMVGILVAGGARLG
jgi:hypothetical protein